MGRTATARTGILGHRLMGGLDLNNLSPDLVGEKTPITWGTHIDKKMDMRLTDIANSEMMPGPINLVASMLIDRGAHWSETATVVTAWADGARVSTKEVWYGKYRWKSVKGSLYCQELTERERIC